MNYKRLVEIDKELSDIKRFVDSIDGASTIDIRIFRRYNIRHIIGADGTNIDHFDNDFAELNFDIIKKTIVPLFNEKRKKLKEEKNNILDKKWWQFWI
jgi:rhodanese-related sulfurtransferase